MLTWFFLLIPIIVAILLLIFWTKKVVWWEVGAMIVPSLIFISLMKWAMVSYNTSDTEYLGSYIKTVTYYEPWDEEVPCQHPIYCTRTVSYECGDGKTSRTCTRTEEYECGRQHAYDVDYHPAHWEKEDNFGSEHGISQGEYNRLKKRFNTAEYFTELSRDYHSIDGDSYSTDWDRLPEHSDVITSSGSYTNKIQASHSVFKFETINEKEKKRWKLYNYPNIVDGYQPVVLGKKISGTTDRKLQFINGYYGPNKQFKLFILFFKNQSMSIVHKQRSLWDGGNKNEMVICIGIDASGKFEWVDAFSWMDKPRLEVEIEDYFNTNEDVNLYNFSGWLPEQVEKHWKRKQFKDFQYLQIELTETQIWWILIIVIIYNIICSIWVIKNGHENTIVVDNFSIKIDAFFGRIASYCKLGYTKMIDWFKRLKYK